jgi:thymidylate kinase
MSQVHSVASDGDAARTGPRGRFVCFEGVDGAGKTTLGAHLAQALNACGEPAVFLEKKSSALTNSALSERMARLKTLIWDYGEAPIAELGDDHSLYIMAAWFSAFDQAMVAPRLANGISVVVDNWFHKFVARFEQKREIDIEHVRRCFARLTPVDRIVFLDVDLSLAAGRKNGFTQGEVGNLDGVPGRSVEEFVRYQSAIRETLRNTASTSPEWLWLRSESRAPGELARILVEMLGPWPTSHAYPPAKTVRRADARSG